MARNSKKWNRRMSQIAQIQKCPDGGWGWVVVVTSVMSISNFSLLLRCFSVFYTYLMKEFNADLSEVAWITALCQAGYGIACPLTPLLIRYFSYRQITIASSLVACLSICIASFQSSLLAVQVFAGLIPGFCFGPIMISGFTVCSRYFDEKRNLATQILCGGLTMGGFFYCPTLQLLIDRYAWQGAMLVIGGLFLHSTIAGAAMRPLVLKEDFEPSFLKMARRYSRKSTTMDIVNMDMNNNNSLNNNEEPIEGTQPCNDDVYNEKKFAQSEYIQQEEESEERYDVPQWQVPSLSSSEDDICEEFDSNSDEEITCGTRVAKIIKKFHLQVLTMPLFYLYSFSYVFFSAGYVSGLNYLVPYGKSIGLGDMESSSLISAVMAGEILTRIVNGYFLGKVSKHTRVLFMACYIGMLSFSFTIGFLANSYKILLFACCTMGIFGGCLDGLFSVFMTDAFGLVLYPAVFGYGNVLIHVSGMASTIIIGKLVDIVGDISVAFYVGIGTSLVSAVITIIMRQVMIKELARKNDASSHKNFA